MPKPVPFTETSESRAAYPEHPAIARAPKQKQAVQVLAAVAKLVMYPATQSSQAVWPVSRP